METQEKSKKFLLLKSIKIIVVFCVFGLLSVAFFKTAQYLKPQIFASKNDSVEVVNKKELKKSIEKIQIPIQPTAPVKPIEAKKDPVKSSVKPRTAAIKSSNMSGKTVKTSSGNKTVIVAEGNISSDEILKIAQSGPSGNNPYTVKYVDETGQYADMEKTLKDYLNNKLKWSGEISSLYGIKVVDAGDTGWAGQYAGSYTTNSSGAVVSVFGWINLNIYYGKSYTRSDFERYMKLVLSHEYGHHYTLYYKWTKWKLLAGTRFPDDYYNIRPLTKATTTFDYSLGATDFDKWANCDAEIIAEDYSYIYSGFGYQAMSEKYGYPTLPAVANWLSNILPLGLQNLPANYPPTVAISAPNNGAEVSGTINISAEASDDKKVSRVSFFEGNDLIYEDSTLPYQASLNTSGYANGNYVIKTIAYDEEGASSQASISLVFQNTLVDTQKPVISIILPTTDPFIWPNGDFRIEASATDNVEVIRMEIYINDILATDPISGNRIGGVWSYDNAEAGTYVLKIKAYDAAGNFSEKLITIIKQ